MIRFPRLRSWVMNPKKRQQKLPRNGLRQNKARMTYKLNGESKISCLLSFQCPPYYSLKCHKSPRPPNRGGGRDAPPRVRGWRGTTFQFNHAHVAMQTAFAFNCEWYPENYANKTIKEVTRSPFNHPNRVRHRKGLILPAPSLSRDWVISRILLPSHEKIPIVEYYTISYHEKVSYKGPIPVGAFPGVDCHIWAI